MDEDDVVPGEDTQSPAAPEDTSDPVPEDTPAPSAQPAPAEPPAPVYHSIADITKEQFDAALHITNNSELAYLLQRVFWAMMEHTTASVIGVDTVSMYDSSTFPYPQQIANMFNIDIRGETPIVRDALLRYPIHSKAYLGTLAGVTKALSPILQNIEIKTHDNTPGMAPYTFTVRADNSVGMDQKKAIELINRFACLRDNSPELVLIDVICEKPFTLVTKIITTNQVLIEFNKETCNAE